MAHLNSAIFQGRFIFRHQIFEILLNETMPLIRRLVFFCLFVFFYGGGGGGGQTAYFFSFFFFAVSKAEFLIALGFF